MTGPEGVRRMLMRGGTSKGGYFLAEDLPFDPGARDDLLLRIMGSPDPRQIDGLGGAHPLTSKVAVVSVSQDPETDVDYLFLQIGVDRAEVSDRQNCGNLLAGVGPFALSLLAPPAHGGTVMTRTFIPVRCHTAIGVLGAASVAAGLCVEGNVGEDVARLPATGERLRIEHPTGFLDIDTSVDHSGATPAARGTAVVRTARKIFDGTVFPRPA